MVRERKKVFIKAAAVTFNMGWAKNKGTTRKEMMRQEMMLVGRTYKDIYNQERFLPDVSCRAAQGFVPNKGKFVYPDEAAEIALAAGQVKKTSTKIFKADKTKTPRNWLLDTDLL